MQAAVDFARDLERVAVERDLGREGALRPAEQRRQHLAGLVAVVVDGLLAEYDKSGLLGFGDTFEDFRNRERFNHAVDLHEDAAVGTHGERGADGLGGLLGPDRGDHDLGRLACFLEPERFFDGDLVERVHGHFDVAEFDAGTVRLDPDFHVLVDCPFHGHEDFHGLTSWLNCLALFVVWLRPAVLYSARPLSGSAAMLRCETYRP